MFQTKLLKTIAFLTLNIVLCAELHPALADSSRLYSTSNDHSTLAARIVLCLPDFAESFIRQSTAQQTQLLEPFSQQVSVKKQVNTNPLQIKHTVLFLCNANMERSPMAERMTNSKMPRELRPHFYITSAALKDKDYSDRQLERFTSRNHFLRRHIPLRVTPEQLKEAAIIFVMTYWQKEILYERYPFTQGKVFLLMGEEELHPLPDDYAENGPTYQKLQNTITLRLPMIYKKLQEFLINKGSSSSIQKNIVYTSNSILIGQAI